MTIEERYAHWRDVIETQKTSGLSIAAYCRNQQIRSNDFYAWRRRISKRQTARQGFLELSPSVISSSDTGFRIILGNLCIEVQRHFDPATLRTVVACLSR
ncbi:MAG: hypothetical protein GYA67_14105 [Smithella sp.]|jgi:hypothetical protein|nr:hypothetical protein [Syntrophaceae bacterium]NMC92779.1 hypothetical protein [Smithella sp.]HOE76571.1 hypothetical protein [Rectinema sp.]